MAQNKSRTSDLTKSLGQKRKYTHDLQASHQQTDSNLEAILMEGLKMMELLSPLPLTFTLTSSTTSPDLMPFSVFSKLKFW